jgi:para-nitrobenzyl esterase
MRLRASSSSPLRTIIRCAVALGLAASAGLTAARPAAAVGTPGSAAAGSAPLVVRTTGGRVRGLDRGAAREFLGVPYAASTAGAQRWRPPRPHAPWRGIMNATRPGPACAQTGSLATGVLTTSTAENCLFLNVYTPRSPRREGGRRGLPVMVWIPGGGFTGGAGSIYDGAVVAAAGSAVVVTINYRLNAFGFLALPSLDGRHQSSGDYGLMDQQAAMRWVRGNARAFGGDPRNVTIFGESAGGASVCMDMASPTARGLFSRAIAESGCLFPAPARQQAEAQGGALAARLGCARPATAAACLRAKPVAAILKAEAGMGWSPVIGAPTLPTSPISAFLTGHYTHVPLLQGSNHDEGRFFVGLDFDILQGHPMTRQQYPQVLTAQFGAAHARKVIARYPLRHYRSPDLAYAAVFTDADFSCPALFADDFTQRSQVYAYEFSDPSPPNDFGIHFSFPLGAAHSTELQYVFQRIPLLDTLPPFTRGQLRLSDLMIRYWTRFAATGNPNGARQPRWPRFAGASPRIQELIPNATGSVPSGRFAAFHQCNFWASLEA